jgi:hypothetical protein
VREVAVKEDTNRVPVKKLVWVTITDGPGTMAPAGKVSAKEAMASTQLLTEKETRSPASLLPRKGLVSANVRLVTTGMGQAVQAPVCGHRKPGAITHPLHADVSHMASSHSSPTLAMALWQSPKLW